MIVGRRTNLSADVAYLSAPGHVTHAGVEPTVALGEIDSSTSERARAVADAFASCRGVSVELSDDIQRENWTKFLFISAMSGVGAVSRVPAGGCGPRPRPATCWRELGVATPVNESLYAVLSPQEARVRERGMGRSAEPTGGPA